MLISMVRILAAGTWWSTKLVRRPNVRAEAVDGAAMAAVVADAVETAADVEEEVAAEIAATGVIGATAAIAGRLAVRSKFLEWLRV